MFKFCHGFQAANEMNKTAVAGDFIPTDPKVIKVWLCAGFESFMFLRIEWTVLVPGAAQWGKYEWSQAHWHLPHCHDLAKFRDLTIKMYEDSSLFLIW